MSILFPRLTSAVDDGQESIPVVGGVGDIQIGQDRERERERESRPMGKRTCPRITQIYISKYIWRTSSTEGGSRRTSNSIPFVTAAFPPAAIVEGPCH